ncbi:nitrate reductase [Protomyces lactucae-debilis]|uniref:Nitrate reductase n=1 Tax=Protomyces lactucae-debilis TaxID=2754530 RepID=A0A1Y2F6I3_PROLT|nr:nitrate reductase [Protomyces lactucae-debilis]ORY78545.1 nitrate reductase [Protomyces lactucae-debilis]
MTPSISLPSAQASRHKDSATTAMYPFPMPRPHTLPTKVAEVDLKTNDKHVCRDERMIRLTGNHPFNSEAPLSTLFDEGFLTPPELFYVRNHGACPAYTDQECLDWKIEVSGLVDNPFTLSLKSIMEDYEQITLPVTMVCAGNRRKEQNMVRKGSGFNWGAAGVSTSLWTGPLLRDIIAKARPQRAGKFVCFRGDDDLPNGNYETCVRMSWAKSFDRAIQLAYLQNGEPLTPDHGRPIRVVIPGAIGGRSVKWLSKIIIQAEPSTGWYHINDNRVLPTQVDPAMAKAESKWWQDERYAIYDLNVQSAIVYPAHDEIIQAEENKDYTIRGYAYNGGGVRIGRVELSIDSGRTWQLAEIEYPEDQYRDFTGSLYGGKIDMADREACWCWCFYALKVPTTALAQCTGIVVRAMDENMNLQPRDMYWSVMSMMNNCWFRVAVHKTQHDSSITLRFEHPTQPALMPGGWMPRVKDAGGDLQAHGWGELVDPGVPAKTVVKQSIRMTKDGLHNIIKLDEVEKHKDAESCWFINDGEVYDATPFLKEHPGGIESITGVGGEDSTEDFMAIHSETAKQMLVDYHIGTLEKAPLTPPKTPAESAHGDDDEVPRDQFLEAKKWHPVQLVERQEISSDARILRFKLDHDDQLLGLPCGKHLFIKTQCPTTNDIVMRAYTPVSEQLAKGFLDILVKVYFASTDWPTGGKMTLALESLRLGDTIQVKGPTGHIEYLGRGKLLQHGQERTVKRFLMVSGGSGITPVYQILRAIHADEADATPCVLLDSNRHEQDILCREDLDMYGEKETIDIYHTLSGKDVPADWQHGRGRVTEALMESKFGDVDVSGGTMLLLCGPPALEALAKQWALGKGMSQEDIVVF